MVTKTRGREALVNPRKPRFEIDVSPELRQRVRLAALYSGESIRDWLIRAAEVQLAQTERSHESA